MIAGTYNFINPFVDSNRNVTHLIWMKESHTHAHTHLYLATFALLRIQIISLRYARTQVESVRAHTRTENPHFRRNFLCLFDMRYRRSDWKSRILVTSHVLERNKTYTRD